MPSKYVLPLFLYCAEVLQCLLLPACMYKIWLILCKLPIACLSYFTAIYSMLWRQNSDKILARIKAGLTTNSSLGIVCAKMLSGVCCMTHTITSLSRQIDIEIWHTIPSAIHVYYVWCEYHSHFQWQFAVVPI